MSKTITIELTDEVFDSLEQMAREQHRPIETLALEWVMKNQPGRPVERTAGERRAARESLLKYAGAFSGNDPRGSDNEKIDAALAKEYDDEDEATS